MRSGRGVHDASVFLLGVVAIVLLGVVGADPPSKGNLEPTISEISILLPITSPATESNHRLEAFNGCFRWSSTKPDVVTVTPLYEDSELLGVVGGSVVDDDFISTTGKCANAVLVNVSSQIKFGRESSVVIAEDIFSGRRLQCEVFVDLISRISLVTTSRIVYRSEMEALGVQAYDSEGNLFSSVNGVQFAWSVSSAKSDVQKGEKSLPSPLKMISHKEASLSLADKYKQMEEKGFRAGALLVQGVVPGKAVVTLRALDSIYALVDGLHPVEPVSIDVLVFERYFLTPYQPLFVVVGAKIAYALNTTRSGISLPSKKHVWSVSDESVCSVSQSGVAQALALGQCQITVQDLEMNENNAHVVFDVVEPVQILLSVRFFEPESLFHGQAVPNWSMILDRKHIIAATVMDRSHHNLIVSENMVFEWSLPSPVFTSHSPISPSTIGSFVLPGGVPLVSTIMAVPEVAETCTIGVELVDIKSSVPFNSRLSVEQEVVVHSPVVIEGGPVMTFPLSKEVKWNVSVSGGSGMYVWSSDQPSVVGVSHGELRLAAVPGKSTVSVHDLRNPANWDSVVVRIVEPDALQVTCEIQEVQLGEIAHFHVGLFYSNETVPHCSFVSLAWEFDSTQWEEVPATESSGCAVTALRAKEEGRTRVAVSTQHLSASVPVSVFAPLMFVSPVEEAQATLGASVGLRFVGGPSPLNADGTGFFVLIEPEERHLQSIQILKEDEEHFLAICLEEHDQIVRISVGNTPTTSFPTPRVESIERTIVCGRPHSLSLSLSPISKTSDSSCVTGGQRSSFALLQGRKEFLVLTVRDEKRRVLGNYSSLMIDVSSSVPSLASPVVVDGKVELSVSATVGNVEIYVESKGYLRSISSIRGIVLPRFTVLGATAAIRVCAPLTVESSTVALLPHRGVTTSLIASGGSGMVSVACSTAFVHASYADGRLDLSATGQSGRAVVTVRDRCIVPSDPVNVFVTVGAPDGLSLRMVPRVVIGGSVPVQLVATVGGVEISQDQLKHMNGTIVSDSPCLVVGKGAVVTGVRAGRGSLTGSLPTLTPPLFSDAKEVIVYAPLRAGFPGPSGGTPALVEGASVQLWTSGGPGSKARVHFRSNRTEVLSVSENGVVCAMSLPAGLDSLSVRIDVKSEGFEDGVPVIYGTTDVHILVTKLFGVSLHVAPDARIVVGTSSTVQLVGLGDGVVLSPFSFGVACDGELDPVRIEWTVSRLRSDEGLFARSISGEDVGSGSVRVEVEHLGIVHSDSRDFEVVSPFLIHGFGLETISLPRHARLELGVSNVIICHEGIKMEGSTIVSGDAFSSTSPCPLLCAQRDQQYACVRICVRHIDALSSSLHSVVVPLGSSTRVVVHGIDAELVKMRWTQLPIEVEFSHSDVVRLRQRRNSSEIDLVGIRRGSVVVRIGVKDEPTVATFLSVHVVSAIVPSNAVVAVDGVVQFEPSGSGTRWLSDDLSITWGGLAHCSKPGMATVHMTNSVDDETTVRCVEVSSVHIGGARLILNGRKGREDSGEEVAILHTGHAREPAVYWIPLTIWADDDIYELRDSDRVKQNVHLVCKLSLEGTCEIVADGKNGWACVVSIAPTVSENEIYVEVSVRGASARRSFAVHPRWAIHSMSADVQLSRVHPSEVITIVSTSDGLSSSIAIESPPEVSVSRVSSSLDSNVMYLVEMVRSCDAAPFARKLIHFTDTISGHTQAVSVSCDAVTDSTAMRRERPSSLTQEPPPSRIVSAVFELRKALWLWVSMIGVTIVFLFSLVRARFRDWNPFKRHIPVVVSPQRPLRPSSSPSSLSFRGSRPIGEPRTPGTFSTPGSSGRSRGPVADMSSSSLSRMPLYGLSSTPR